MNHTTKLAPYLLAGMLVIPNVQAGFFDNIRSLPTPREIFIITVSIGSMFVMKAMMNNLQKKLDYTTKRFNAYTSFFDSIQKNNLIYAREDTDYTGKKSLIPACMV